MLRQDFLPCGPGELFPAPIALCKWTKVKAEPSRPMEDRAGPATKHGAPGGAGGGGRRWLRWTRSCLRSTPRQTAAVERLFGFLRIPSVSAVPAHFPDCDRAADWLVAELGALGFEAAKHPTDGRPMVLGHLEGARRGRAARAVLRPLRCSAGGPAGAVEVPAVRAEAGIGPARRAHRRARRRRRQGPADDLPRGVPRLPASSAGRRARSRRCSRARRRPARPRCRPSWRKTPRR